MICCARATRGLGRMGGLPIRTAKATLMAFVAFRPMTEQVCRSLLDLARVCRVLRIRGIPTNHEVHS